MNPSAWSLAPTARLATIAQSLDWDLLPELRGSFKERMRGMPEYAEHNERQLTQAANNFAIRDLVCRVVPKEEDFWNTFTDRDLRHRALQFIFRSAEFKERVTVR